MPGYLPFGIPPVYRSNERAPAKPSIPSKIGSNELVSRVGISGRSTPAANNIKTKKGCKIYVYPKDITHIQPQAGRQPPLNSELDEASASFTFIWAGAISWA